MVIWDQKKNGKWDLRSLDSFWPSGLVALARGPNLKEPKITSERLFKDLSKGFTKSMKTDPPLKPANKEATRNTSGHNTTSYALGVFQEREREKREKRRERGGERERERERERGRGGTRRGERREREERGREGERRRDFRSLLKGFPQGGGEFGGSLASWTPGFPWPLQGPFEKESIKGGRDWAAQPDRGIHFIGPVSGLPSLQEQS